MSQVRSVTGWEKLLGPKNSELQDDQVGLLHFFKQGPKRRQNEKVTLTAVQVRDQTWYGHLDLCDYTELFSFHMKKLRYLKLKTTENLWDEANRSGVDLQ
jgi:hypothetical protein